MVSSEWIWYDGAWVKWEDATLHVTAHALHYGSSVFEGVRTYSTPDGPAIFRLRDHLRRLHDSAKLMRMDLGPWNVDALEDASVELVDRNGHESCYVRPLAFRGSGGLGIDGSKVPVSVVLMSFEWGAYLGAEAVEQGVDAGVSSWRRFTAASMAPLGKIGGQYVNNQLASVEARINGYGEAIVLDERGNVCEGGGENLFVVHGGTILTPHVGNAILAGITRDSAMVLARELGYEIRETTISRDLLYLADEVFMTGTATEITPVRSVDRIPVGEGRRGPVTERLQEAFFEIVQGKVRDRHGWLTQVRDAAFQRMQGAA